jgi:hypothetical protein
MNISTTAYNPFKSAAQAAIAELTSDQAQRYYAIKAQKDFQTSLDSTLTLIGWVYQLSEMVYHLGALSRSWCDQMVAASEQLPLSSSYVLCPAAAPVALLPAAPPKSIRLPGALASSGVAIVTPEPANDAPVQEDAISLVGAERIEVQSEVPTNAVELTQSDTLEVPGQVVEDEMQLLDAETVALLPSKSTPKTGQRRSTSSGKKKGTATKPPCKSSTKSLYLPTLSEAG